MATKKEATQIRAFTVTNCTIDNYQSDANSDKYWMELESTTDEVPFPDILTDPVNVKLINYDSNGEKTSFDFPT